MTSTTSRAVHLHDPLARHWFVVRHDPLRADWTADRSEATPLLPRRLARMRELFPVELMGCEEHRIGEPDWGKPAK